MNGWDLFLNLLYIGLTTRTLIQVYKESPEMGTPASLMCAMGFALSMAVSLT